MTKKIILLILIVIISIILASIYGILHNQISYSISSEYFTELKFEQFGFVQYGTDTPRLTAGLIGIWSTWWFGLIIGLIIGISGMFQRNSKIMWNSATGAIIRTLGITIGIGVIGIAIGYITLPKLHFDWNIPSNVKDRRSFLSAGTMHTFSYFGGLIGLIYGIKYQMKIKKASAQQRL